PPDETAKRLLLIGSFQAFARHPDQGPLMADRAVGDAVNRVLRRACDAEGAAKLQMGLDLAGEPDERLALLFRQLARHPVDRAQRPDDGALRRDQRSARVE